MIFIVTIHAAFVEASRSLLTSPEHLTYQEQARALNPPIRNSPYLIAAN